MREIKFRFWDKENKKMWHSGQDGESIGEWTFQSWFDSSHKLRAVIVKEIHVGCNSPMVIEVCLKPMQYTGLKDKNGKEIYEGDIVEMHYFFEDHDPSTLGAFENETEIVGKVFISEYGSGIVKDDSSFYFLEYIEEPSEEFEVIGNIYENNDLLEVQIMKNYEYFNRQFGGNESAEVQAFKMVITDLCNDNGINIDDETLNRCVTLFKLKSEWLKEEK